LELYLHSSVHFHRTVTDSAERELERVHERESERGGGGRYKQVLCVSEVLVMLRGHGEEL
jgi:hypothetical protein